MALFRSPVDVNNGHQLCLLGLFKRNSGTVKRACHVEIVTKEMLLQTEQFIMWDVGNDFRKKCGTIISGM